MLLRLPTHCECRGSVLYLITLTHSLTRSYTHTQTHTHTLGMASVEETSTRPIAEISTRKHVTHKRQTAMHPAGFQPAVSPSERPQNRAATEMGVSEFLFKAYWLRDAPTV